MLTFSQFLKENTSFTFGDACAAIKRDCSRYLNLRLPLFRGITVKNHGDLDRAWLASMPVDRSAKNSEPGFVFTFNAMIDAAWKIKDIRSQAVFACADNDTAGMYGSLHFMFPKNDVSYIWSSEIYDSYVDANRIFKSISAHLAKNAISISPKALSDGMFESICTLISAHDFAEGDAAAQHALDDTIQKMIRETRIAQDFNKSGKPLLPAMINAMRDSARHMYMKNTGLSAAVNDAQEVLFYGGSGYYIVPVNLAYTALTAAGGHAGDYVQLYKWVLSQIQSA